MTTQPRRTAQILGIETSCDETAAAVVTDGRWVRSNVIASQHELHRMYRGVVPEIASRAHVEKILPVIDEAMQEAGVSFQELDAVAVGNRPGLIGSLMVGVGVAKSIAWAAEKPLIGVNHIQAHLYARCLCQSGPDVDAPPPPSYPAIGLVVSGGHTSLFEVRSPTESRALGKTIDDAAGEAYDKAAVILGVDYPGGPNLDRLAQQGDPTHHDLPRSLLDKESLDFSFSGLKTALLYKVRGQPRGRGRDAKFERSVEDLTESERADLAASFQAAVVDVLMLKLTRAMDHLARQGASPRSLLIGGGVAANSLLRRRVTDLAHQKGIDARVPPMSFCLDNAAMIAGLAYPYWEQQRFDDLDLPAVATTMR